MKAATSIVNAAGAANQRVLKPAKMKAGAMSSPKMVRLKETVVPRPIKSMNLTGSPASRAWVRRSYLAQPCGIIKKEVPARSRKRPSAFVMGTNIGEALVVWSACSNPKLHLANLAVGQGISTGRHGGIARLVLYGTHEPVIAHSRDHTPVRIELHIGRGTRAGMTAHAEVLQHGLNGSAKSVCRRVTA